MSMNDREILMLVRQALLLLVDAVERKLGLPERTADLRKKLKEIVREPLVN
jgi:hypothetical protein